MVQEARQFWDWFRIHADQYRFLEAASEKSKSVMLELLREHLQQYCDKLFFEIGGQSGEDPELIITAEGRTEFFEKAEKLVSAAPKIGTWKFCALIPPRGSDFQIGIEGYTLNASTLWFQPMGHPALPELNGLRVCIPHYELMRTKEWLQPVIAKMVEYILGEKVYAIDIHYIEVGDLPEVPSEMGMFPLPGLTRFLTWRKERAMEQIRNN
jgi:hypothetical protein